MRSFRCRECGEVRETDTKTGPLPATCGVCDPDAAERRAQARAKASESGTAARLRAATERIRELEVALAFDMEAQRVAVGVRFDDAEETPRHLLGRAVRRVAHARGRDALRAALLELAGVCRAWARVLAASDDEREAA
jgi:hypothetical protein